jgi:hypothetical protein
MAKGECNCGAVKFEIDKDLSDVFICHCSICRRSTGSNGIAVVVVPNDTFRWVQGEDHIVMWSKPNSEWQTWFCGVCGSPGTIPHECSCRQAPLPREATRSRWPITFTWARRPSGTKSEMQASNTRSSIEASRSDVSNSTHFRDFIQIAGVRDADEANLLMECGIRYLGFPLRLPVNQEDLTEAAAATIIRTLQPPNYGVAITYQGIAEEIVE